MPGADPACSYAYDRWRAGAVAAGLLADVRGPLVTDDDAAFIQLRCHHQRCGVHLRRARHARKQAQATAAEVVPWAPALRDDWAQAAVAGPTVRTPAPRVYVARRGEAPAARVARRCGGQKPHPCQARATRPLRHQGDRCAFVRVSGRDADTNRAARHFRPLVVQRKISGGTRAAAGTTTRLGLASLFQTWHARGLNPFRERLALLHSN